MAPALNILLTSTSQTDESDEMTHETAQLQTTMTLVARAARAARVTRLRRPVERRRIRMRTGTGREATGRQQQWRLTRKGRKGVPMGRKVTNRRRLLMMRMPTRVIQMEMMAAISPWPREKILMRRVVAGCAR